MRLFSESVPSQPGILNWPSVRIRVIAVCAAGIVGAAGGEAKANLITNGSFEDPAISDPWFTYFAGSGDLLGWGVGGASVDVVNGDLFGVPAYDGIQFLDIAGSPGPGGIAQDFATDVGQQYQLTFFYIPRGFSAKVTFVTGSASYVDDIVDIGATGWQQYSRTYTALHPISTLIFQSQPGGDSDGVYIDAISVEEVSAVPEPSSMALLGIGACVSGLGAAHRRRRARTVGV
jgi:hypothetical protein